MKKVLSLVLVIAMVLSSMSFAFAGTFEDVTGDYEDAVQALSALGVINGYEDGTFRPEKTVTRAEMAKILVEALGYGDLVAGANSNFADTQAHWANGYVAIATGTGLVMGYPDGTFAPDKTVTYDEALTMVLRALGYNDAALKGTWPTNYKVKAIDLDLTDDVVMATSAADRGGVAQIIYNALDATLVEINADNEIVKITEPDGNDEDDDRDEVILLSKIADKLTFDVDSTDLDADNDDEYKGDIVDLTPYMYENIDAYVNDDDEVVFVYDSNTDTVSGVFEADATGSKVGIDVEDDDNEYVLTTATDMDVYYNGLEVAMDETEMEATGATYVDLLDADVKAILNDDDEIVKIVANKYTDTKQATKAYNGKAIAFAGITLPLDDSAVDFDKLTVKGAVEDLTDVEEDDVIVVYAAGGLKTIDTVEELTLVVVRDTVEGKITRENADGEFNIDGTYYATSPFAAADVVEIGDEGTFYLDDKGDIFAFEEDDSTDPVDYAIVVDVQNGVEYDPDSDPLTDNSVLLQDPEVTLVNKAGEEVTYEVDTDADVDLLAADDLTVNVAPYDVVKYKVEDGLLTEITDVITTVDLTPDYTDVDTESATFVLASNVVIFNYDVADDEVVIVDVADLGDEIDILARKFNSDGQYEFLFVKGTGAVEDTYVYVTDDATILDEDDEPVQEIIGYVDGEEVSYETDDLATVVTGDIDAAKLFLLTFEDGIVTEATPTVAGDVSVNAQITKVSDNRFRTGTTDVTYEWFTLADDVVVYVLDDGDFNYVGDASSIYDEANVVGYTFDADNVADNIVEVLFIFE